MVKNEKKSFLIKTIKYFNLLKIRCQYFTYIGNLEIVKIRLSWNIVIETI